MLPLDSEEVFYPLRFLVQGMVLFKESLSQWSEFRRDGTANKSCKSKRVPSRMHIFMTM
jgi:hypothetical protein